MAAMHPSAAAVTACLYLWSRTSPAAKTPGTLVSVSFLVTTSFPLKKNPSQVAQLETPLPLNFVSDGSPSHLAFAPVAMITLFPSYDFPPATTLKGLDEKSTNDTSS